jgi:hypothetical protein
MNPFQTYARLLEQIKQECPRRGQQKLQGIEHVFDYQHAHDLHGRVWCYQAAFRDAKALPMCIELVERLQGCTVTATQNALTRLHQQIAAMGNKA